MRKLIPALVMAVTAISAGAHDFEAENADGKTIYYRILDDGTAAVTYQGTSYRSNANRYTDIINIPEEVSYSGSTMRVTAVDPNAFYGCTSLTEAHLPRTINSLGEYAFYGCKALTTFNIPEGVTSIPGYAFYNCTAVTGYIIIPSTVTEIAGYAFYNCYGNKVIGENVKTIGTYAFAKRSDSSYASQSLVFLGKTPPQVYTYTDTFGNTVTNIDNGWFMSDRYIPKGTKTAYTNAKLGGREASYDFMRDLQAYTITSTSNRTCSVSRVVYSWTSGNSTTYVYPPIRSGDIIIPASIKEGSYTYTVESVATDAYRQESWGTPEQITSIVLPRTIKSIGNYVFYNLTSLTKLKIETSTPPSAGSSSFYGITSTCTLVVPAGSKSAYSQANYWKDFANIEESSEITINVGEIFTHDDKNYEITSVNPPECCLIALGGYNYYGGQTFEIPAYASVMGKNIAVTEIAERALYSNNCEKIIVGPNVRTIGKQAFYYGKAQEVVLPTSLQSIGEAAFSSSSLKSIILPAGITELPNNLFYSCSLLTDVKIKGDVTSIGSYAFYSCRSLSAIDIPQSVTNIGNSAFQGCSSLSAVDIPQSVTSIGSSAFSSCSQLTSVAIPEGLTELSTAIFRDCSSLSSVTLPSTLQSIGQSAFGDCSSLADITLPGSLTAIGSSAFYGTALTSIDIPWSVETITGNPFAACANLERFTGRYASTDGRCLVVDGSMMSFAPAGITEYTIPGNVTAIVTGAFSGVNTLSTITIPATVQTIGRNVFAPCTGLRTLIINDSPSSLSVDNSFSDTQIETVYIGRNITWTSTYSGPFNNIKTLREITYSEYVTTLPSYMFYGSASVDEITIPSSMKSIGNDALKVKSRVTCLATTPPTLTRGYNDNYFGVTLYVNNGCVDAYKDAEGWNTFKDIKPIPKVGGVGYVFKYDGMRYEITDAENSTCQLIAPDSEISYSGTLSIPMTAVLDVNGSERGYTVTAIAANTLTNNDMVTAIRLPAGMQTISGIDHTTSALTEITVDEANPHLAAVDGVLYDKDITTLILYPTARGGNYVTPETLRKISGGFYNCTAIESIVVTDSVSGYVNASNCKALRTLIVGNSLTSFSAQSTALDYLEIGTGVTDISGYTMYGSSGAKTLVIRDSSTPITVTRLSVDDGYIAALRYTQKAYIGRDLVAQGYPRWSHFHGYTLYDVEFGPQFTNLDEYMLWSMNSNSCKVHVPSPQMWAGVTKQGKSSYFPYSYNLCVGDEPVSGNLKIEGISEIKDYAFYRIENGIDTISIGAEVETIGAYAFGMNNARNVNLISCRAQTPPKADATAVLSIPDSCILGVPRGCRNAYKSDAVWSRFAIEEYTESGKMVGDANCDNTVSIADVVNVLDYILCIDTEKFDFEAADMNNDADITVADIVMIIDIILENSPE